MAAAYSGKLLPRATYWLPVLFPLLFQTWKNSAFGVGILHALFYPKVMHSVFLEVFFYFVKTKSLFSFILAMMYFNKHRLAVPGMISPVSAMPHEGRRNTSSLPLASVSSFMFYLFWHAFLSFCFFDCDQSQGQPEFHLFHKVFLKDSGPLDLPFLQC